MRTTYSISVGLACVTGKKRGHFPYIDHDKGDIQAKGKLKICIVKMLLCNIEITV